MSFFAIFASFFKHRYLIFSLAKREIASRYRGSTFGAVWSIINPLLLLGVYTFVFSSVFEAKWGQNVGSKSEFAMILFCGLIVFTMFSETIVRAPTLILNHATYVKKVVFPLEVLIWVALLGSLFNLLTSFIVLLSFELVINQHIQWTVIFFPIVILPLVLLTAGICWFLASLGVFLRDIGQMIGILTTILLFMSPIFYPSSSVPVKYQAIFKLNPVSFFIEEARNVVIWGNLPSWVPLAQFTAVSLLFAWLGFAWFQKTRKGFADVL